PTGRPHLQTIEELDVIIVGARVAGSAAAIMLARSGLRVLLLDKATFPSDTISTHIVLSGGAQVLSRIGAMELLERAGGFRFSSMRTLGPGFDFSADLKAAGDDRRGLCLGREKMDAVMLELAGSFDRVTIEQGFRLTDLVVEHNAVLGVRGEGRIGASEFHAPLVIGADGMRSSVAKIAEQKLGAFRRSEVPCARAYYYAYFEGVARAGLGDQLVTEFEASPGAGNLLCRCEDDRVVAAAAFDANQMSSFRTDLSANLQRHLNDSIAVGAMLAGATRVSKVRSSGLLLNTYRDPVSNGALLLGDSGLHVDPLFGQGHSMALISAEIACGLLPACFAARAGTSISAQALAPFTARRDEVLMRHFRASERVSRDLTLSATTLAAYRAASREQWAADEMIQFAQMSSEARFPSFRFARLMAQEARAA
ncbi:MAG TPA: NAD(P)/FAD-dependent oxidoreductase, partial [Candidatus Binataceae bacterium]|nr:NAD(P)/FAD-dependent oxidoreductase [Candidatus Binataceae bacterium]